MTYRKIGYAQFIFVLLFCCSHLFSMDIRYRRAQPNLVRSESTGTEYTIPANFLHRAWYQRLWSQFVVIAQSCRCRAKDGEGDHYDVADSVDTNDAQSYSNAAHATNVRKQIPQPPSLVVPPSDDAFIEQHYGYSKNHLETSLACASEDARDLVEVLRNPELYDEEVRVAVLHGIPGAGKSRLARAMAYKAGWFIETIVGRTIRGEHRGATSINLQKMFELVIAKNRKTVVIIDEINRLFENYNSAHFDTGDTAEDFWTFSDDHKKNTNLYIIGTTNHIDKLPPQLKSRLRSTLVEVTHPDDIDGMKTMFLDILNAPNHKLASSCDDLFLSNFLPQLLAKQWNARDISLLRSIAVRIARRNNKLTPCVVITTEHLTVALNAINTRNDVMKYGTEDKSHEEQQQENHREQLKQNKSLHDDNLKQQRALHDETVAMQKEQFVQGLRIQKEMQSNQKSGGVSIGGSFGTGGANINGSLSSSVSNISFSDACITNNLTDEQRALYRRHTQSNEQREVERKRVKALFESLQEHISFLTVVKQLYVGNQANPTHQRFVSRITNVITDYDQCYTAFQGLMVPSVAELQEVVQQLAVISPQAATLKAEIEAYIQQQSSCVIS